MRFPERLSWAALASLSLVVAGCSARRASPSPQAFRVVKPEAAREFSLESPGESVAFSQLMERQYGYTAGRGYIDLLPGMRVAANRAYFSGAAVNLNEYLGAETGRWTIERGPRFRFAGVTAEPGLRKPAAAPPIERLLSPPATGRNRHYRLFFQVRWLGGGRTDQRGSVILGAPNEAALNEATALLLAEKPPACGARLACVVFPPATTVTTEVGVEVNGERLWVAWGATPRSLAPPSARASLRVDRRLGNRYAPVEFARDNDEEWRFPVLPGDRLQWTPSAGASAAAERIVTSNDGAAAPIAFDVRGNGAIALVFVHGWAADRAYWREQADTFASEGYRVVTIDLTGHGPFAPSSPPRSVIALAADVEAVVRDLGLHRVILIGHSMGSVVALSGARRLQGIARAVVLIAPELAAPGAAELAADFKGAMERMVRTQFKPGVNDQARDFVLERATRGDPATAIALLSDYARIDMKQLLAAADVPVRVLDVPDAGHFPQLERPAEFNAMLRGILGQFK